MKKIVIAGLLMVSMGGQALSMGHPHNVFAARKHLKKHSATLLVKPNVESAAYWQDATQVVKHTLCELLVVAVSHFHPVRLY